MVLEREINEMTIAANNSVNVNGFSLALYLDENVTMRDILTLWPDAKMEGYYDEEKGYDGIEAGFSTPNGDFYIYARWGNVRMGCFDGQYNPHAKDWLDEVNAALASRRN